MPAAEWSNHHHVVRWYQLLAGRANHRVFTSLAFVELCRCGAWRVMDYGSMAEALAAHELAEPGLPGTGPHIDLEVNHAHADA